MSTMSATAETWHNPCCLALLDMPEDERPNRWVCDDCGADWVYDSRFNEHHAGSGPYWQAESLRDIAHALAGIRAALEKPKRPPEPFSIVWDPPELTRWQRIKRAFRFK